MLKSVKTTGRLAFTLVELLVVIAIIGMLVGLLLPAVQQAREAARVMQCSNHLKQLGLAATNHESSTQAFPSAGWIWQFTGDPDRGLSYKQPGGWTFSLLPFLEQEAIYSYSSNGIPGTPEKKKAAEVLQMPVPTFHCPSRRAAKIYPGSTSLTNADVSYLSTSGTCLLAKTDYAGNAGGRTATIEEDRDSVYPSSYSAVEVPGYKFPQSKANGIIYACSRVPFKKIKDGTSNTYLLGEKYLIATSYEVYQSDSDDNGIWTGTDCDCLRVTYLGVTPKQDRVGFEPRSMRFGGPHAGTVGMVMCDGSVQRISYYIDKETHYNLGCRNDGKAASLE